MNTGYFNKKYAQAVVQKPDIIYFPKSEGFLIQRAIKESNFIDLINCYPLFCCNHWEHICTEISLLPDNIVSTCLIIDPFADLPLKKLANYFDIFKLFKPHYVVNFNKNRQPSKHHRQEIKRAYAKNIVITHCQEPLDFLDVWYQLYLNLIKKHQITENKIFSKSLFFNQFEILGFYAFRATINDLTIAMSLWYVSKSFAYYHQNANSSMGYKTGASYALMDYSLNFFEKIGVTKALLGSSAGLKYSKNDGLSKFKSGWVNEILSSYIAGKINNPEMYEKLLKQAITKKPHNFFPAYRS